MDLGHDHEAAGHRRPGHRSGLPSLPPAMAAAAVGLVTVVAGMVLVTLGEFGCDAVRGAPSCGGFGVALLALTAAAMLALGYWLLGVLDVRDPGVSSLIGFAVFAIVLMTALLDRIFASTMWIVLPVLGAVTYAIGAWAAARLTAIGD